MKRLLLLSISKRRLLVFALANTGTVMSAIEIIFDTEKSKDVRYRRRNVMSTEILMNKGGACKNRSVCSNDVKDEQVQQERRKWTNKKNQ